MEKLDLAVIEKMDAVALYTGGEVDNIIGKIKEEVRSYVPDTSTDKGRKNIASLARKVSSSKVLLDKAGKGLVEGWKQQAASVDSVRKKVRDELDALRDEARAPLTAWEEAEEARLEGLKLAAEIEAAHTEAIAENDVFNRTKEVERREAELARIEEEKRQKEEAERKERERIEYEERIRKEAEERAKRESEQREREAVERAERAERDRIAAEERAKIEKENAIKEAERRAKEQAERVERERLAKEAAEKAAEEKRQANKKHREKVRHGAITDLIGCGLSQEVAVEIVGKIDAGEIAGVSINY